MYLLFVVVLVATASVQVLFSFRIRSTNNVSDVAGGTNRSPVSSSQRRTAPIREKDRNCIFRDTPLYRSVYVYPSPGEPEWANWRDVILSETGKQFDTTNNHRYPWQPIEERTRANEEFHFRLRDARAIQYTTELIVREILTHPESCLRSDDPESASLFFVPYMVSMEWHNGTQYPKSFQTSPYGQAILDMIEKQDYHGWESTWGYTSKYWKRRQGSDHILVMSEGCHGLSHPTSMAGNNVFIQSQKQLTPPIIIYKDTSRTFVQMYPKCAAKNIVVPAPNPDGRWFNGRIDRVAQDIAQKAGFTTSSPAALKHDPSHRPLGYYYKAGNHGSCRRLRQHLETTFSCSPSGKLIQQQLKADKLPKGYHFPHAFRHATFCPCPGGDTPNSKRYFDALMAGCIPLILSKDFVWPYSSDIPGAAELVQESDISIRLDTADFTPATDEKESCEAIEMKTSTSSKMTIQSYLEESISSEEIVRLQNNLAKAATVYSYYQPSPDLPDHPLKERVLPNGPAAHALVSALADRAFGNRWHACQEELRQNEPSKDNVNTFQC